MSDTTELTSRLARPGSKIAPSREEGPPRLIVLMGSEPGRRYSLEGASALIGRSDDCELQLDDSKVSRRHARVDRVGEDWVLVDLGSRNGTLVNGETVKRRPLAIGDRIQLSNNTILLFTRQDPLEDLLLHRQQMAVIGQLAAGIAHDFNNLLNVISASIAHVTGLDEETELGDHAVRECHQDIQAAARRAAELTARLLTVAQRREPANDEKVEPVDVSQLCDDALKLVARTFDRSIRVRAKIEPELEVVGDHGSLHQLLMNLCINARDAMPGGGDLGVTAYRQLEPDKPTAGLWATGPQVVIEVSDTGTGMDDKTRARVFEPFFTTKAKGAGSGLGLATVYEVATAHGGGVEVESEPGEGATFRVRLPARTAASEGTDSPKRRRASTWRDKDNREERPGRVLIVDDQELVRRSLGRLLVAAGYAVTFASDGEEALSVYEQSAPRPDVVLMDLDMPRLSGAKTLERLRSLDPSARVILISGYYDETRKKQLLASGAIDFLAKPVEASALRDSVRVAVALPRG